MYFCFQVWISFLELNTVHDAQFICFSTRSFAIRTSSKDVDGIVFTTLYRSQKKKSSIVRQFCSPHKWRSKPSATFHGSTTRVRARNDYKYAYLVSVACLVVAAAHLADMQANPFKRASRKRGLAGVFQEDQLMSFGDLGHQLLFDQYCSQLQLSILPETGVSVSLAFNQQLALRGVGARPFHHIAMESKCDTNVLCISQM